MRLYEIVEFNTPEDASAYIINTVRYCRKNLPLSEYLKKEISDVLYNNENKAQQSFAVLKYADVSKLLNELKSYL